MLTKTKNIAHINVHTKTFQNITDIKKYILQ